jgi:sugar/nucleoside kinase (ribokinase family)
MPVFQAGHAPSWYHASVVLVFGTVCLDRLRRVPKLPAPGGYVEIEAELSLLGGEAANSANALKSWGDEVVLAGNPVGDSVEADLLSRLLADRGLSDETAPLTSSLPTPVCEIFVTPDGDRTMFGRGFTSMDEHVDLGRVPWRAGSWFTADPNFSKTSRDAVRKANIEGMKLYLMDFIQADDPIMPGSFWQSSTDWAGHRNNMQRNVQWLKSFIGRTDSFAILSDGPNGFVAGSRDDPVRVYPPFPAPEVVDTTGAGDIFRAGMLHGLQAGWPIPDCLRFASAAGCLKCRHLGATTQVPTLSEIEMLIADNPDVSEHYG